LEPVFGLLERLLDMLAEQCGSSTIAMA